LELARTASSRECRSRLTDRIRFPLAGFRRRMRRHRAILYVRIKGLLKKSCFECNEFWQTSGRRIGGVRGVEGYAASTYPFPIF
jgi:hypothetical protein